LTTAPLADVLDQQRDAERARALRALLRHPLLTPAGPDAAAFALVRQHADWLRAWFTDHAGWSLHVDAGLARLRKVPGDLADGTRAALVDRSIPFSRRRYALLCLALAALERADAQTTLGRLADRILSLAGDPALAEAGFTFALESQEARKDLVVVARLLLRLHVLTKVAGDEQSYVASSGDALYDVDRRVLATLLAAGRGPSMVRVADFEGRLRAITEEPVADAEEGRAIRRRLSRRLLDDPVVYLDEVGPAERDYLATQRHFVLKRLADATGLEPEARAEGMALVDPTGEATDLAMPEEGTDGHATLLLAEHLANRRGERVPIAELEALMGRLVVQHRGRWRKNTAEPGAEVTLCRTAMERLAALGLIRRTDTVVEARPALARFTYAGAVVP
jgi:uncharacterized protein (TIGR02678 family)